MATFSQHHVDGLDMALTPIQALMRSFPNTKEQEIRLATSGSAIITIKTLQLWVVIRFSLSSILA